jgi:hypothetical protein
MDNEAQHGELRRLLLEAEPTLPPDDGGTTALTRRLDYLPPGRIRHDGEPQHQYYYYVYTDETQRQSHNRGVLYWCWRFLVVAVQLVVLGMLSMGSYAVFYQLHRPVILHYQPFQFDYYDQQHHHHVAVPSSTPTAIVRLHQQSKPYQWTALVDDVEEVASSSSATAADDQRRRILQPRQAYYVELTLTLPESPRNVQQHIDDNNGKNSMFGVVTDLYGSNNATTILLATSRRSLRFPYRSSWVRTVANVVTLPLLLLRVKEEVQMVRDTAFRHVRESASYALDTIVVRLLDARVEVLAAELRVGEELSPFQEVIIETWFWTCFWIGSTLFAILYAGLYHFVLWWLARFDDDDNEPPCELNFEEFTVEQNASIERPEQPDGTATDSQQREEAARQHRDSESARNGARTPRWTTHVPTEEVQIPDSFADGSDGDWEDLTIAGNEGQTVRSEASRQGRTMTSNELRRYLIRDDAGSNEAQHPFLVFLDD